MWINNGIIEKKINSTEKILEGFVKGRKPRKKMVDTLMERISKEDLYNLYIIENKSFVDCIEYFNIEKRGHLIKLLRVFNIHKDPKAAAKYTKHGYDSVRDKESYKQSGIKSSNTQKKNWQNKSEEEKELYRKKQSNAHKTEHFRNWVSENNKRYQQSLSKEEKERQNKLRSESCKKAFQNPDVIQKIKDTSKKNRLERKGNLCKTLIEQKIYDKLKSVYDDVLYDVKVDNRYPYFVDFYIPSEDLFIEYQGHPSHGNFPFVKGDINSLNECYKLYGEWLKTYIERDVKKYETALRSNLNFIRIYPGSSLETNYELNNFKYKPIIEMIYNSKK